jgi:hypothetical protein
MTLQEDIFRICLLLLIKLCAWWLAATGFRSHSRLNAMPTDPRGQPLPWPWPLPLAPGALQAFETSQPLPMQRLASMHASMHPCMADSSSAWWRCLASDPGRDTGHSHQLFRPLAAGSESKQPSPASHQEKSAEADFNAPRQAYRDIAHRPSPKPAATQWMAGRLDGLTGRRDVVCRSANSCRL